jgi:hypothetical protein
LQEIKLKSANKVHNEWFGDDKSRVYLAKSNRAKSNIVSNVRITLNNFDVDVMNIAVVNIVIMLYYRVTI